MHYYFSFRSPSPLPLLPTIPHSLPRCVCISSFPRFSLFLLPRLSHSLLRRCGSLIAPLPLPFLASPSLPHFSLFVLSPLPVCSPRPPAPPPSRLSPARAGTGYGRRRRPITRGKLRARLSVRRSQVGEGYHLVRRADPLLRGMSSWSSITGGGREGSASSYFILDSYNVTCRINLFLLFIIHSSCSR